MSYLDDLSSKKNLQGKDESGKQVMPSYEEYLKTYQDALSGFDGGDGQVGVVGDGSNAMEEFDKRGFADNAIGGRGKVSGASKTNRIDKRWSQWGADDLNIKEELKAQGMVEIDVLTGEDMKKVQRQQYENWLRQQTVWQQERAQRDRMEMLDGKRRQGAVGGRASDDYKDLLTRGARGEAPDIEGGVTTGARTFSHAAAAEQKTWPPVSPYRKRQQQPDAQFHIRGAGAVSVVVEPNSMVVEDFVARFTPDTPPDFLVAAGAQGRGAREVQGQLPRRGTPFELVVRCSPANKVAADKRATLVVETGDWKWTYLIVASA